ncbi:MAG TPA: hypothetical protein VGF69_21620 [Thermoanaerobaculia bacterium]|jgi:predicted  nucleic acid-binding Zn-ribbon protein
MADEIMEAFARYHRDILTPELQEMRQDLREEIGLLRREVNAGFDRVYTRLERVETESVAIKAGLQRVELRLDRLEERVARIEAIVENGDRTRQLEALEAELGQVKDRVSALEDTITRLRREVGHQ